MTVTAGGTGPFTYQWYSNTSASNSGGTAVSGATSASFTPPSTSAGTLYYYAVVTGACGSSTSAVSGEIIVNPSTDITSENLSNQRICEGQSFSPISVIATGVGTLSYQWYQNNSASSIGAIPVATSNSYTPSASSIGTYYYYVVVSSDCGPDAQSSYMQATVEPITNITTEPDTSDDIECFGDGFDPLTVIAEGADLTYQWYSVPTPVNSGGVEVPGATLSSFTPPSTNLGISYYYVVVSGYCSSDTSVVSGEYEVTPPQTTIVQHPSTTSHTVCLGAPIPTLTVEVDGEITLIGDFEYQWYSNSSPTNTGGTLIPGATDPDFTPPSSNVGTLYYYATGRSDCGTVPTAVSGAITVYPPPAVTNPATASTCSGVGPNISLTASVPSSFSWTIGTITGGITGASAGSGTTINQTLTNPSNTNTGIVQYVVTPTSITGSCLGAPYTITVTVNPTPAVTNPATASTCSGTGPNISLTASVPSSFSWTIGTITGGVTGASAGSGATINQTLTNPSNATAGTVQYIVTPTSTTGSCPGVPYTITVTVDPQPTVTNSTLTQTICSGASTTAVPLTSTVAGTTFNWTASATAGVSGFTPSGTGPIPVETISTTGTTQGTVTYVITPTANGCSGPSVNYTVLVNPIPTVTNSVLTQTICSGASTTSVPLTSDVAGTIFSWTASATAGVSGFTPSGSGPIPVQNISTTATTQGTVTYIITPTANGCTGPTTSYTVLVNPLATVGPTSVAFPSVCISSPVLSPFTQSTTGVTSIETPSGLPPGITAVFNSTTGNIEFSGTATTTGLYSYSIPLTGNCINGLTATGTIDVTPIYNITDISSVSATSIGGTATVFFYGDPTSMLNGTYEISYQIKQANGLFTTHTAIATVSNGRGTFSTVPIMSNVDTYTVQLLSIKKSTDVCTIMLPSPPTTYFGVCSAVYSSNSTFYVPANVYSITIEVYGSGGGGGNTSGAGGGGYSIRTNIPVTPGEAIGVFVGQGGARGGNNGGVSYATRDSNIANQLGNSLVFANGGLGNGVGGTFDSRFSGENGDNATGSNGGDAGGPLGNLTGGQTRADGKSPGGGGTRAQGQDGNGGTGLIVISYSCPDADNTDCIKVIDDGSKSGTTIIEYICNDTWVAPEGLASFTVIVGSGGGGGGSGFGSGGGGSGALIRQSFTTTNPYGLPAGTSFPITVGTGGNGASAPNTSGASGNPSSFTGNIDGSPISIVVAGGGGGGSQSSIPGAVGASGGGGGARPNPSGQFGTGGASIPISYSGTNVTLFQGNSGGNGDYSSSQNAIAGGGGGGLVPFTSSDRPDGKAAGNGQGEGGDGGKGVTLTMGDSLRYYGAGGGGIGEYFNGTEKVGIGGSANGVKLGGDGNLDSPTSIGGNGINKTGSGGGAGYGGGGKGGDGVVYIYFANYRILSVEYLHFDANYNPRSRTGELTWATAKEWENSHFEIERAINSVATWASIGSVNGAGYSDTPLSYEFEDERLPASGGNIFYRLKQVNLDGTFSYSVTRAINVEAVEGRTKWIAYPNPSKGNNIQIAPRDASTLSEEFPISVVLANSLGQTENIPGSTLEQINQNLQRALSQNAPGVYLIHILHGNNMETLRIIKI